MTKTVAPTGDPLGPMGEAVNYALSALATSIMEDADALTIASDALKAMQAHRQGDYAAAIDLYKRADARCATRRSR